MRKLVLALCAVSLLAGCGNLEIVKPPPEKMVCDPEPDAPGVIVVDPTTGIESRVVSDEENGEYLKGLRSAGGDCRSKLEWIDDFFSKL